jgi:hypothetical protein
MPNEGKNEANAWNVPNPRPDLAFPKLTEDMVERLRPYGQQENFPANFPLFTHGERGVDMFVVLDGQIDMSLPAPLGIFDSLKSQFLSSRQVEKLRTERPLAYSTSSAALGASRLFTTIRRLAA